MLGALLFLIYINDIPVSICYSSVFIFADDTMIFRNFRLIIFADDFSRYLLQNWYVHADVSSWSEVRKVCLNVLNCAQVTFSLSGDEGGAAYEAHGSAVMKCSSYKDLEVLVSMDGAHQSPLLYCLLLVRNIPASSTVGLKRSLGEMHFSCEETLRI